MENNITVSINGKKDFDKLEKKGIKFDKRIKEKVKNELKRNPKANFFIW
jgi:osmotically-inducible protein OsmY